MSHLISVHDSFLSLFSYWNIFSLCMIFNFSSFLIIYVIFTFLYITALTVFLFYFQNIFSLCKSVLSFQSNVSNYISVHDSSLNPSLFIIETTFLCVTFHFSSILNLNALFHFSTWQLFYYQNIFFCMWHFFLPNPLCLISFLCMTTLSDFLFSYQNILSVCIKFLSLFLIFYVLFNFCALQLSQYLSFLIEIYFLCAWHFLLLPF
jgi:hypothetical protein